VTDPRHLLAADASRRWYDTVFALHGGRPVVADGLWTCADPPPWHSAAITLTPGLALGLGLALGSVAGRLAEAHGGGVADAFADLDLTPLGYHVLFEATWVHRPAPQAEPPPDPGWARVETSRDLAEWSRRHDYDGVFTDAVLGHPDLAVLAHREPGTVDLDGGVVLHRTPSAVGVSNLWGAPGWDEVRALAAARHPGLALVGYEHGADLEGALAAGWSGVGTHRVWVRG
jgi:hypothetical protein